MISPSDQYGGNNGHDGHDRSRGYPRPLLQRPEWWCLNGKWDFAIDADASWSVPEQVAWDATILVPFAPETPASGVHETGFYRACWYRRAFEAPELHDQRLIVHFGAVDYRATVWVNGSLATQHEGGYTPFWVDVTDLLAERGPQVVVVRAEDDPHDLAKPRGKQDWQLKPHSIWYPRTTGLWQTVWLERVPLSYVGHMRLTPNVERWEIGFDAVIYGQRREDLRLHVTLHAGDKLIADDSYLVVAGEVNRRIALSDPGIDDYRNELLWTPARPQLIHVELQLRGERGQLIDNVLSYTALRSIGIQGDRFVLNSRPYQLRMVLDQNYWPDTGTTAPDDEALRTDVELAKAMGFNGVRKHQIIADPRYLYWADTLGLMVWEEMPSAYRFTRDSVERLSKEWIDVIHRDSSHPCIIAWVPFNESWGIPDLPDSPSQQHYVKALYNLTKTLDPTRPVIGNDGWESVATDIVGIHDYDDNPDRILRRYANNEEPERLFKRERPGGRMLTFNIEEHASHPVMLTEFGGITLAADEDRTWGYSRAHNSEELAACYRKLLEAVRAVPIFAGYCYTQFADTYQEANGLLYADRRPKFPLEEIALATGQTARSRQIELAWRERMMQWQRQQQQSRVPSEANP